MREVCGDEDPGDANTNLNDPKCHPQKGPHKPKPEKIEDNLGPNRGTHYTGTYINSQSNIVTACSWICLPLATLSWAVTKASGKVECWCDHYIPDTRRAHGMTGWTAYTNEQGLSIIQAWHTFRSSQRYISVHKTIHQTVLPFCNPLHGIILQSPECMIIMIVRQEITLTWSCFTGNVELLQLGEWIILVKESFMHPPVWPLTKQNPKNKRVRFKQ